MPTKRESSLFSPSDVRAIRAQDAAGTLNVRAWAAARRCAAETIRRIARRETYNDILDVEEVAPAEAPGEPLAADVARSFEQFRRAAEGLPPQAAEVEATLDEMRKRGDGS